MNDNNTVAKVQKSGNGYRYFYFTDESARERNSGLFETRSLANQAARDAYNRAEKHVKERAKAEADEKDRHDFYGGDALVTFRRKNGRQYVKVHWPGESDD